MIPWILFNLFILLLLFCDLFVFHRKEVYSTKRALLWSSFWVALALLFNLIIYFTRGAEAGLNFLSGYLIEKALSLDNLFVFALIFDTFKTPQHAIHKVLFWGIIGAMIMRGLLIFLGLALIQKVHIVIYLLGLLLVGMGVKFIWQKKKNIHLEKNPFILFCQYFVPMTEEYSGNKFFTCKDGKRLITPLFIVLLAVESTDLLFALDSLPAIFAITQDPFIIYTSNVFALLGLRSHFSLLSGMLKRFTYFHYALAAILIFVGLKMLLSSVITLSPLLSLLIIACIIVFFLLFTFKKCK